MESGGHREVVITDYLADPDPDAVLGFLTAWVTGSAAGAREHLADHAAGEGTTLVGRLGSVVAGLVTVRWTSRNRAFAEQGIPLVHQLSVDPELRRLGVATALLDAAEQLAASRGCGQIGITVGLFDVYGPAQRLYARRGYVPDGRGACRGQVPLRQGETVEVGHDLILWLTKDL
jgi:GNAT superfamily N-acetyltransferase